eukprot:5174068-Prymnesium_polylepis.1
MLPLRLAALAASGGIIVAVIRVRRRAAPRRAHDIVARVTAAEDLTAQVAVLGAIAVGAVVVVRSPSAHLAAERWAGRLVAASRAAGEGIKAAQQYIRSDVILGAIL